jgi:hypothetical protein
MPAGTAMTTDTHLRRGGSLLLVDFTQHGNSAPYRLEGWSGQEQAHVWAVGEASSLRLPAPAQTGPLVMDLDVATPQVNDWSLAIVLRVTVNGTPIGAVRISGPTRVRCLIDRDLLPPCAPIDIRFDHPCHARISFLRDTPDDRSLGACFYALALYPPWLSPAAAAAWPLAEGFAIAELESERQAAGEPAQAASYAFRAGREGQALLGEGWHFDAAGNAWSGDRYAQLALPAPTRPGRYAVRFDICPLFVRDTLPAQRVNILLDGAVIGQFKTGYETVLCVPLPAELADPGGTLRFTLALPDGLAMDGFGGAHEGRFLGIVLDRVTVLPVPDAHAALAGLRDDDAIPLPPIATSARFLDEPVEALPDAVHQALGIAVPDILRHFDSLGDNCAFGIAQRKAGCDVLGLLRFANAPLPALMRGIEDGFRAADDKGRIALNWVPSDPGEFVLGIDEYGIHWHTDVFDASVDAASLFARQAVRLGYLRRKFYEGLAAGRKIMTVSRADPRKHPIPLPQADELPYWEEKPENLRWAELLPLFLGLNERGRNTLLFLTHCERGRRPGTVELLAPGVMRGYTDSFVISADSNVRDHASWMRIAANAWLLEHGANAGFRGREAG